ncbi:MAG: hypothetical protein ACJAVT_001718 [Yoonia sp.]|jgi:hypothetical protein
MAYEYRVIPAPARGLKAKGLKTAEDRFANALQTAMNEQAASGWEYLRADTLPSEQREGLMSKTTVYQNMLVFRRVKAADAPTLQPPEQPMIAAPKVNPAPALEKLVLEDTETPKPDKKPDAGVAAQ